MTWIVARTFYSGYAAMFSDVNVTWGRKSADCLRKVYAIAPNMACGFSGSVEIGFNLLGDMRHFATENRADENPISPRKLMLAWYRRGRKIFDESTEVNKRLGCSLMLAGFSPNESVGTNMYSPRTDIIVMKSVNGFKPDVKNRNCVTSIGSGNAKDVYANYIEDLNEQSMAVLLENEYRDFGRAGQTMALLASNMMRQNTEKGISSHVHCTLVGPFGVRSDPINYTCHIGENKVEHIMPPVAQTYSEFKRFESDFVGAEGAAIG